MASSAGIYLAALTILVIAVFFSLALFALLRIRAKNEKLYFSKWHYLQVKGLQTPLRPQDFLPKRFPKRNFLRTYLTSFKWIPAVLKVPEHDLIDHAGLDSAVYLRSYLTGLKILVPICVIVFALVVPVNYTNENYKLVVPDNYTLVVPVNYTNDNYILVVPVNYTLVVPVNYTLVVPVNYTNHNYTLVVPVNYYTNETVDQNKPRHISGIDKLSILNVPPHRSKRFWIHIIMAYAITFWTCYVLRDEYQKIATMRMDFMTTKRRRPTRYTVLVRNVPSISDTHETVSERVESFFKDNYPDHYLTHQLVCEASKISNLMNEREERIWKKEESQNMLEEYRQKYGKNRKRPTIERGFGFLCYFKREDAIDFYTSEIERLNKEIVAERLKVQENHGEYIKRAAFVFFKTQREALLCAQTQQSRNSKFWTTEWAPEPSDVSWNNLAFSSISLPARRIVVGTCFGLLTFFSTIASAFILSHVTVDKLEETIPGFDSITEPMVMRLFFRAILPQVPLMILIKIFEYIVDKMTIFLRLSSMSATERRNASWGYILKFINSFLIIIIPEDVYYEIIQFLYRSPIKMAKAICRNMPEQDSFFIVYTMLCGTGVASEIIRWKPFRRSLLRIGFWVQSQTSSISQGFDCDLEPDKADIQFYLLLALVYALVSPLLLFSVILFLALSYLVYRNQFINVYHQEYDSAAAYWPDVHGQIIVALISSQLLLMGFLRIQPVYHSIPLLLPLSIFTIAFHRYCKARFEPLFLTYPMEKVTKNDALDKEEPIINLKDYLINAYTNPALKDEKDQTAASNVQEQSSLVPPNRSLEGLPDLENGQEQSSLVPPNRSLECLSISKRELRMIKSF